MEVNQSGSKVILGARGSKVQPRLKMTSARLTREGTRLTRNFHINTKQDKNLTLGKTSQNLLMQAYQNKIMQMLMHKAKVEMRVTTMYIRTFMFILKCY